MPALNSPARIRDYAHKHERRNALHTLVGLLELAAHDWEEITGRVREPLVRALLVGKTVTAAAHGIELSVSRTSRLDPRPGTADGLVTVLGNLIDNAVDALLGHRAALQEGPRIEVTLDERGPVTELLVADNGPGVPPGRRRWIFVEGASTKRHTGAGHRGLGLALVSDVLRERGGTVAVTERPGGGAQFTVRLPRTAGCTGGREAS